MYSLSLTGLKPFRAGPLLTPLRSPTPRSVLCKCTMNVEVSPDSASVLVSYLEVFGIHTDCNHIFFPEGILAGLLI